MACTYGASVKSGVDPDQLVPVDRALWESVTATPASWLDPILDTFTQEWIKTSDLCALNLNDPALPSTADLIAAAANPASIAASLYTWVRDKLRYVQFSNQCVCNGAPAGGETLCLSLRSVSVSTDPGTIPDVTDYRGFTSDVKRTWFHYFPYDSPCNAPRYWALEARKEDGTLLDARTFSTAAWPGELERTDTWPAETRWVRVVSSTSPCNSFYTRRWSIDVYCYAAGSPTAPTAPVKPSQPPDLVLPPAWSCSGTTDVCTRLQQLDQRIRSIQDYVTLIQRQRVPFAYVSGASFTATGAGSHAVQGILGLSVSFTTLPSGRTNYPDNPASYFDLGWLSLCTADGCEAARPLRRQVELILDVSPAVTAVRWSLPSGAVASITPLLRLP